MKRFGLIEASADGVVLGYPRKRHLLLSPDGISWRVGRSALNAFAWEEIERLQIDVPTTRSRLAWVAAEALSAPVVMAVPIFWDTEPPAGGTSVTAHGEVNQLDIDRRHFGGYWLPAITATQLLLNGLIVERANRASLDEPRRVVATVADSARSA